MTTSRHLRLDLLKQQQKSLLEGAVGQIPAVAVPLDVLHGNDNHHQPQQGEEEDRQSPQPPLRARPRPRPTHNISSNNNNNNRKSSSPRLSSSSSSSTSPDHTMGICLLIKDDNELLPEFLAYHYHAVDLRHVVVGVDPTSATSPVPILERFRTLLPDFTYVVWNDDDYMYDWFLEGNYSRIPDFIGNNYNTTTKRSIWHDSPQFQRLAQAEAEASGASSSSSSSSSSNNTTENTNTTTTTTTTSSSSVLEKEILQGINIHRFRQAVFVGECIRHMKDENLRTSSTDNSNNSITTTNKTQQQQQQQQEQPKLFSSSSSSASYLKYMAHIDTDEMLVVNPHFLARDVGKNDPRFLNLTVGTATAGADEKSGRDDRPGQNLDSGSNQPWMTLEASSVRQLLEVWHRQYPFTERSCRYLPRVLFGAVERGEMSKSSAVRKSPAVVPPIDPSLVPDGFDSTKFESLRFKWHAAWNDNPVNGFGKVILDLDELRKGREAILRPKARVSGIHQISPNLCGKNLPYTSAIWDNRPLATYHYLGSEERHCAKDDPRRNSILHHKKSVTGSKFPDTVWLDQWLSRFVEMHGLEKSQQLLPEYLL